ncbi:hypothetical protein PCANC_07429 [Puccinia coronata f. sp. avenae]|uniref:Uncharacterized protein n=1 Tax=Puccinia coronata f. sp. avenae TaxID=200324 RepID=A0A2N5T413_9BASI|nr:hypothetical protein PCANC_07429 [Puccinia coronata f. sp. avenae]
MDKMEAKPRPEMQTDLGSCQRLESTTKRHPLHRSDSQRCPPILHLALLPNA